MSEPQTIIRPAREADLSCILEIYNIEVASSTATYDTEPRTEEEHRKWFHHHGPAYPVLVAEREGRVCGWASLSPWSDRLAYSRSVEVSVYVAREYRRSGAGRLLMLALITAARERGHHALLSRISADNEASIRLHADLGFAAVGTLREVGVKFGRLLDVAIMEMLL